VTMKARLLRTGTQEQQHQGSGGWVDRLQCTFADKPISHSGGLFKMNARLLHGQMHAEAQQGSAVSVVRHARCTRHGNAHIMGTMSKGGTHDLMQTIANHPGSLEAAATAQAGSCKAPVTAPAA
jgi:hypothetical protein